MTINFDEIKSIVEALRARAKECEKKAELPGYFQKYWEDESNHCYRLAREFGDVVSDGQKTIRVTYIIEGEG